MIASFGLDRTPGFFYDRGSAPARRRAESCGRPYQEIGD